MNIVSLSKLSSDNNMKTKCRSMKKKNCGCNKRCGCRKMSSKSKCGSKYNKKINMKNLVKMVMNKRMSLNKSHHNKKRCKKTIYIIKPKNNKLRQVKNVVHRYTKSGKNRNKRQPIRTMINLIHKLSQKNKSHNYKKQGCSKKRLKNMNHSSMNNMNHIGMNNSMNHKMNKKVKKSGFSRKVRSSFSSTYNNGKMKEEGYSTINDSRDPNILVSKLKNGKLHQFMVPRM